MTPSLLYEQWPPITVNELLRVMAGDPCAQVVDVRETKEYSVQYVPGSTNLPLSTLKTKKLDLDKRNLFISSVSRAIGRFQPRMYWITSALAICALWQGAEGVAGYGISALIAIRRIRAHAMRHYTLVRSIAWGVHSAVTEENGAEGIILPLCLVPDQILSAVS